MPQNQEYFGNHTLKELVRNILSASDEVIEEAQNKLMDLPKDAFGNHTYIQDLLPRLQEQYDKSVRAVTLLVLASMLTRLKLGSW